MIGAPTKLSSFKNKKNNYKTKKIVNFGIQQVFNI
jgi:hypothetical protein